MSASPDTGIERLRSLLFAPAVRPDFIEKLPPRGADGVVIDCEDATPPNAKAEGRANARAVAPEIALARASSFAFGGVASSQSITTPSAPRSGSFAMKSGRTAGANRSDLRRSIRWVTGALIRPGSSAWRPLRASPRWRRRRS